MKKYTSCDKCEGKTHSEEREVTFIYLTNKDERTFRIVIRRRVCLKCGPILVFELSGSISHLLQEALTIAGFDLDSPHLQIKETT